MLNSLKTSLQYILPKIWLTRLTGWGANKQAGWLTKITIDLFVRYYKVDMKEAIHYDTSSYPTFNDFFTRQLKENVRPLNTDPNVLVMPADGLISQLGKIREDQILQAKNHFYSLESLLAGNCLIADKFRNGNFITIYLSPHNYHRVHMPCNGVLREMTYVPGDLFSVNYSTIKNIPNVYARNERVICLFDTEFGPMVQILIGSIFSGSIEISRIGVISPPREGIIKRWTWPSEGNKGSLTLTKGQEMGKFRLGSTVINLFAPNKVQLISTIKKSSLTKVGEPLAISAEIFSPIFNTEI